MTDLQHIVTRAEQTHNRDPELDKAIEEMAEANAHPMAYPENYQHGYVKPAFVLDVGSIKAKDTRDAVVITHPGPITMAEPRKWHERVNWWIVVVIVAVGSFWGLVATGVQK